MKAFLVGIVSWILFLPVAGLAANTGIPDWVKQAATARLPDYPATTRAVVLLDELVVTVQPDGTAVTHYRRVVKILRPQGREYATAEAWSDNDEKLNYIHAWSIAPDGHEYTVRDNEFVNTSADEAGMLFIALNAKVAHPPAADPGAVIAFEYEQRQRPYVNEEDWFFQESVPVCHAVFEVDLPHGWNYYSAWLHYEPSPATESTPGHHRWELHNVPAIDMEDVRFAPATISLVGRMTLHYGPTDLPPASKRWASVGVWFEQLASPRATVTPEIAAKSQELIAGQNSFTGRLQAITQYLQANIRYVGIEIGIGGWQPHSAAEVFHNRYGDCKDKATLLKTMLESVGIHATWVMVDTRRGGVDPAFPSIYGNHMMG